MQDKFYIQIAGLCIEMNARYDFARSFCRDYITEKPENGADITAKATNEAIEKDIDTTEGEITPEYAEILCLYRCIAEQLPKFGRFVFHGAAISYADKGYLFTAPSGTGKSTHIKLWRTYIGKGVDIINGDKPILRIDKDGVSVCSTPWAGKENWQKNRTLPLGAICILKRGQNNEINKIEPDLCVNAIMNQVYLPKNTEALSRTLENIDKLLKYVPVYSFKCDISEDAVKTSFPTLTGDKYPQ